jgi:hypothetical protein
MSDEVTFYTNPMSRGRMIHWMLEEVGAPYRVELIYLRWMFFGAGCVDPGIIDRFLQRPVPERFQALGYRRYEDMVSVLEKAVTPGSYAARCQDRPAHRRASAQADQQAARMKAAS